MNPKNFINPSATDRLVPFWIWNGMIEENELVHALFEELRHLRSRLASERNVPPYIIFSDATLQQMAYYIPQSRESLSRISGVGAIKLEQLGDAFLPAIRNHARMHNLAERNIPSQQRDRKREEKRKEKREGQAYSVNEIRKKYPKSI